MSDYTGFDPCKLAKIEPSADIRELANAIAQLYQSLILEGFNDAQALALVGNVFRSKS